ncbi:Putative type-1 secretion protein [Salmonella sp. NCTC 11881]|nr:Putative type-1 secretion protein [Salmonella sp. NCTC 11881]
MAIFALTIPVFSNLFYDKLVPSASVSSLFGVAIIVAVFIVFEFILRTSKDIYQSITARQDDVDIDIAFLEAVLYSKKKNGRSMSSAFVLWNEFQKIKPVFIKLDLSTYSRYSNIYYISHCYICKFRSGCYCTYYHVYRLYYYFPR